MDSVIEIQRSHHEERERIIAAIVVENMEKKTSHREQVNRFTLTLDHPLLTPAPDRTFSITTLNLTQFLVIIGYTPS